MATQHVAEEPEVERQTDIYCFLTAANQSHLCCSRTVQALYEDLPEICSFYEVVINSSSSSTRKSEPTVVYYNGKEKQIWPYISNGFQKAVGHLVRRAANSVSAVPAG